MKKAYVMLCLMLFVSPLFADDLDTAVRWKSIVGVITAANTDNPVGNIHSGTAAWSVRSGQALVNLATKDVFFEVEGLVFNGTIFSGTPGPVTAVTGTLVCNGASQTAFDTPIVTLDGQGDAQFAGHVANIPFSCPNPNFLVRVAAPAGAAGRWLATGAVRTTGGN